MNVRSERMSVSARFSDTAQLGRVCKKSVRPSGRGVQGGSLSKKLSLNCLYTCVIFYRIPADLKMPGFRPRNGCFPGRFRPGPGGGPAWSLHPSPGGRFSALGGLPAALRRGSSEAVYVRRFCRSVRPSMRPRLFRVFAPGKFRPGPCRRGSLWAGAARAFPLFPPSLPCPGRCCSALAPPVVCGGGQGGNAPYPLTRFRPLPVLLSSPTGCGGARQTVFSPLWRFMPWKWARPRNALLWAPGGCSGSLVRAPGGAVSPVSPRVGRAVSAARPVRACGAGCPPQGRGGAAVVKRPRGGPQDGGIAHLRPFSGPFGPEM